MKKIIGIICIITMIFSSSIQVFANKNNSTLTIETVTAEAGASVDVPIIISDNTGICGAAISLSYDENLVLTKITGGTAFSGLTFTKPGNLSANPINLLWDGMDADYTNGTIATLTFTVPEQDGTYEICISSSNSDIIDGNLNPVTLDIVNGAIKVAAAEEEHNYTYEVAYSPTLATTGIITGTCSKCSDITNIILPKLNADDYTYEVLQEATCDVTGLERYTWNTTTYGEFYFDVETSSSHSWDFGTETKEATCKETGEMLYTCKICGETKIEPIDTVPCYTYSYTVTIVPTGTTEGEMVRICDVCGKTKTDILPKLNSSAYMYEIVEKYDCVNAGVARYSWVGELGQEYYFDVEIKALGHSYEDGVCTRCGMADPSVETAIVASGYSGDLEWTLTENGVLTFSGTGAMKNYTYKSEMPWYSYMDQIVSVVIEAGATRIGSYAFYGMPNMKSIVIPETVTTIGDYAFKNATALDGVVLPSNLTTLGDSAFYGCSSLTAIDIPTSLYTVKPYTFKNCTSLATVTLHEGNLMKLSDGAFYNTALTEVTFPVCLDIIDVYCFKNCSQLASITIPEGDLTQIREAVFYGTAIPSITIPEGITKIGPYAFKNCTNLVSVELPITLTSIEEAGFYSCTSLKSIILPDAVTEIGNYAFRKCAAMTSVKFGNKLVSIGESSFYGCSGLKELVLPEKVTTIDNYAFKGCTGIEAVTLPDMLSTIGDSAFHTCTGLSKMVIPADVESIGEYCFSGSYNLWEIIFEGDAPTIGNGAFNKIAAMVYYPSDNATWTEDVMQNYGGTITWKETNNVVENVIASGECETGITWSLTENGVMTIEGSGEIMDYEYDATPWYDIRDQINLVKIEKGVTGIGDNAFLFCVNLKELTIADSVLNIGDSAFAGCESLVKVKIPGSVSKVEDYAFNSCENLSELILEEGVVEIGTNAFYGCAITTISFPDSFRVLDTGALRNCKSLTEVNLNKTETIGSYAFESCSALTRVVLPECVSYVGNNAFNVGGYTLEDVYVLNPECEIIQETGGKTLGWPKNIIYGYANSTAQAYAEANSREFVVIEE